MNKLESIVAVGVVGTAVVLAACTADKMPMMPAAQPTRSVVTTALANPCPMPPAPVEVTINQVNVSGSSATIKVNPEAASIPRSSASVHWKFNAPGYRLAANAVTFKASQPPGPSASAGDDTDFYWCFSATAASAVWKYNVSFSPEKEPTKIYDCDPTIVNTQSGLVDVTVQTVSCMLRP